MRKKKIDPLVKVMIFISCLIIVAIIAYIANLGMKVYKAWDQIYTAREKSVDPISLLREIGNGDNSVLRNSNENDSNGSVRAPSTNAKNVRFRPFTIALFGVDSNNVSSGRSDTIIVAIVDHSNKKVSLTSLPRDTYAYIPKIGRKDKINSAYAYGGPDAAIGAVENYLGIPIDYYVSVDFRAVRDFVDAIGGIKINVEEDMTFKDRITHKQFHLSKGVQKLNGIEALNYARFRYDAEGDFGRNRRQQQVIKEMLNATKDIRTAAKLDEIVKILGKNVRTDISFQNMLLLATQMDYIDGSHIHSVDVKAYPFMQNGISYVGIKDKDLAELKQKLKDLLYIK
jgi:LCP family protein required for cell wall assembly